MLKLHVFGKEMRRIMKGTFQINFHVEQMNV